jgi:hypothetical protein
MTDQTMIGHDGLSEVVMLWGRVRFIFLEAEDQVEYDIEVH